MGKDGFIEFVAIALTACHLNEEPPPAISGNICQMIRQKLETQVYKNNDRRHDEKKKPGR